MKMMMVHRQKHCTINGFAWKFEKLLSYSNKFSSNKNIVFYKLVVDRPFKYDFVVTSGCQW